MENHTAQSGMVTVAKFLDPTEAHMAQGALEANGIASFIQGEIANSLIPVAFRARLQVAAEDEAAAREILDAADATDPTLREGEDPA